MRDMPRLVKKCLVSYFLSLQMEELQAEVERLLQGSSDQDKKVAVLMKQIDEKDSKMKKLSSDRQKHLEEAYEMK